MVQLDRFVPFRAVAWGACDQKVLHVVLAAERFRLGVSTASSPLRTAFPQQKQSPPCTRWASLRAFTAPDGAIEDPAT